MMEEEKTKEQKNFEKLMRNLEKVASDQSLRIKHPFSCEEEVKTYMAGAQEKGITSLDFSAWAYNEGKFEWFASNLDLMPDMTEINLSSRKTDKKLMAEFLTGLQGSKIKKLDIMRTIKDPDESCAEALINLVKNSNLEVLHLNGNEFTPDFNEKLAEVLPSSALKELTCTSFEWGGSDGFGEAVCRSNLEKLDISGSVKTDDILLEIAKDLPKAKLQELNLSGIFPSDAGIVEAFAQTLPLSQIKTLTMDFGDDDIDTVPKFCDAVGRSQIKELNADVCVFDEDHERKIITPFMDLMKNSASNIDNVHVSFMGEDDLALELSQTYKAMRQRVSQRRNYEKTVLENKQRDLDIPETTTLAQAVEQGIFTHYAAQRKTSLTAAELMEPDANNTTILEKAAQGRILADVFRAKNWDNVKEMQLAWNAVGADHKWQMDGKDSRPSYQKEKNDVGQKALNTILSVMKKAKKR